MTADEVEKLASTIRAKNEQALMKKLPASRKRAMVEILENKPRVPTLDEVDDFYMKKKQCLLEELHALTNRHREAKNAAMTFWSLVRKEMKERTETGDMPNVVHRRATKSYL